MKIVEPSDKDLDWAERLENGSNTRKMLIGIVGKKRVVILVTSKLKDEDLLDGVCGFLKLEHK